MKIKYFEDTDTLLLYVNDNSIVETKEADQNTYLDYDSNGNLSAITIEHYSEKSTKDLQLEGLQLA